MNETINKAASTPGQARRRRSTATRHSYVRFFASDWIAGTARMSRTHKSVYHDVCLYVWDKAEPVPAGELVLMVSDLPDGQRYVDDLLAAGKLVRLEDGSVCNPRAMAEARASLELWTRKSEGGARGADKTNAALHGTPDGSGDGTPVPKSAKVRASGDAYPDPDPDPDPESKKGLTPLVGEKSPPGPDPVRLVVDGWNAAAEKCGLPLARWPVAPDRRKLIQARLKEHGLTVVLEELAAIPTKRKFLGPCAVTQWRADLGKVFTASKFTSLLEGRYDRSRHNDRAPDNRGIRNQMLRLALGEDADARPAVDPRLGSVHGPREYPVRREAPPPFDDDR